VWSSREDTIPSDVHIETVSESDAMDIQQHEMYRHRWEAGMLDPDVLEWSRVPIGLLFSHTLPEGRVTLYAKRWEKDGFGHTPTYYIVMPPNTPNPQNVTDELRQSICETFGRHFGDTSSSGTSGKNVERIVSIVPTVTCHTGSDPYLKIDVARNASIPNVLIPRSSGLPITTVYPSNYRSILMGSETHIYMMRLDVKPVQHALATLAAFTDDEDETSVTSSYDSSESLYDSEPEHDPIMKLMAEGRKNATRVLYGFQNLKRIEFSLDAVEQLRDDDMTMHFLSILELAPNLDEIEVWGTGQGKQVCDRIFDALRNRNHNPPLRRIHLALLDLTHPIDVNALNEFIRVRCSCQFPIPRELVVPMRSVFFPRYFKYSAPQAKAQCFGLGCIDFDKEGIHERTIKDTIYRILFDRSSRLICAETSSVSEKKRKFPMDNIDNKHRHYYLILRQTKDPGIQAGCAQLSVRLKLDPAHSVRFGKITKLMSRLVTSCVDNMCIVLQCGVLFMHPDISPRSSIRQLLRGWCQEYGEMLQTHQHRLWVMFDLTDPIDTEWFNDERETKLQKLRGRANVIEDILKDNRPGKMPTDPVMRNWIQSNVEVGTTSAECHRFLRLPTDLPENWPKTARMPP
jgi:hypothetical protein